MKGIVAIIIHHRFIIMEDCAVRLASASGDDAAFMVAWPYLGHLAATRPGPARPGTPADRRANTQLRKCLLR